MTAYCSHAFEDRDPFRPRYSMTEVDLAVRAQHPDAPGAPLTIRRDHQTGRYQIWAYNADRVVYEGSLADVVNESNRLEGSDKLTVGCGLDCPHRNHDDPDAWDHIKDERGLTNGRRDLGLDW